MMGEYILNVLLKKNGSLVCKLGLTAWHGSVSEEKT